jgi:hypothetical protein
MPAWKGIVGQGFSPDAFNNYVSQLAFNAWRPSFVVLHNTAVPTFAQWHSVPGATRMQNLQIYYRDQQHWSGGPHLFIADDLIWIFTPLTVPGVHSPSWNNVSWGVELVGDYSVESMNPNLKLNAIAALGTLHAALGLSPDTLRLHREDPLTTHICPGNNVSKPDFIQLVAANVQQRAPGDHSPVQDAVAV